MARRARGTGRLYQRGDVWWIQFSQAGKQFRESTGTTLKMVAQATLTKRLEEIRTNTFNPDSEKITVAEIVEHVFAEYKKNNRPTLRTLNGRWNPEHGAGKDRKSKRTSLQSFFGHLRCSQVNFKLLEAFQLKRLEEGAAPASINRELNILKVAWKYAMQAGELKTKPVFPKGLPENVRKGFIKDQDYLAFVDACMSVRGGGLWFRTAFEIAYTLGLRKREIINLRLRNVDLNERVIRLEADQTKTGKSRTVPLTELLFTLISECVAGKTNPDDYVLTRKGNPIKCFWDSWKKVTEMAGRPGVLFHDLRRSAVSSMIKKGIARKIAMSISGHATESVFHRYAIIETTDQAEALKMVEQKRAADLAVKGQLGDTNQPHPAQPPSPSTTSNSIH